MGGTQIRHYTSDILYMGYSLCRFIIFNARIMYHYSNAMQVIS